MPQVLDLDDWALSLFADGQLTYSEPAAALDTEGSITFGRAAAAEARVHPRRVNQSYLARLNAEPLAQPFRQARNHADLLYHHLKALAQSHPAITREPLLVTVRSATTPEQLGLVLGVAAECGLRVGAFVDRGVASLASLGHTGELMALDVGADQGELCQVSMGAEATRLRQREFPGQGLNQIQDGWVNSIADHFIRNSRFDPLHAATTEQQLYDIVRGWFNLGEPATTITIEHQRETRRLEVQVDELRRKLQERLGAILQELAGVSTVCLGPNASSTPLLAALIRQSGVLVHCQGRAAVLAYVEQHVSPLMNPAEVRFLTTLPLAPRSFRTEPPPAAIRAAQPAEPARVFTNQTPAPAAPATGVLYRAVPGRPTHGLHGTIAYAIGSSDLPADRIGADPGCGTTLEIDGRLFTLIEVRS